jgi:hypothetical protein
MMPATSKHGSYGGFVVTWSVRRKWSNVNVWKSGRRKLIRSPRHPGCYRVSRHNVAGIFANLMLEVFRQVPIIGFK